MSNNSTYYTTSQTDILLASGYTRVLSEDKETLYYKKDGKNYRRFGNKLVEF